MFWSKRILCAFGLAAYLIAGFSFAQNQSNKEKSANLALIKTQLAIQYLQSNDYRGATAAIEDAVRADSSLMPAWLVRGHVYQHLGVLPKAEESYKRALSLEPGSAEANNNYGWFLCNAANQADKSIVYFEKALSDPTYPEPYIAWMNKGICLGKLNRFEEANSSLINSLNAYPDFSPALKELVKMNVKANNGKLADVYFQQYRSKVRDLSAEDLYLGIQVGRLNNNYDQVSRLGAQLRENYPYSPELQKLLSGQ